MTKKTTPTNAKRVAIKKSAATSMKKASFDASPVSRKEIEAVKAKLRERQNKQEAVKIAKAELAAEKKALKQKASEKLMADLQKLARKGK